MLHIDDLCARTAATTARLLEAQRLLHSLLPPASAPAPAPAPGLPLQPQPPAELLDDLLHNDSPVSQRLRVLCQGLGLTRWRFRRVAADYYDWTLEQRRAVLQAPGTEYLCKSLILENTKHTGEDSAVAQYYLVVIQYRAKLHKEKMIKVVQDSSGTKLGKKKFNFRFADPEVGTSLSGFEYNAVTPLGMKTPLPIILDEPISKLPFFWLGGGEVDLKWGVLTNEFIKTFNPAIGSVSDPDKGSMSEVKERS